MENMKVGDVFELPMVCEQGDGYLYSKDLRYSIVFDDSDTSMMKQKTTVAIALNNHDRLVEENAELREMLQKTATAIYSHNNEMVGMHAVMNCAKESIKLLNK